MRPYPEELLRAIQGGVMAHFLPELQSNYAKAQFGFGMLLFAIAQRGNDTAVPDLLEANRTLRALLGECAAALAAIEGDDAQSAHERLAALPAPDASLRLSDLRRENEALRAALASLATLLEAAADVDALAPLRDVRAKIYAWLADDARARIVPILTV